MYFVISPEGERYGPVTRDILQNWCREGRILPDTLLESQETGQRSLAGQQGWQENGRHTALLVESLPALPAERWQGEEWLGQSAPPAGASLTNLPPTTSQGPTGPQNPPIQSPPPTSGATGPLPNTGLPAGATPVAHTETQEFRARVYLTPEEVTNGAERRIQLTGYAPGGMTPPEVVKTVAIPPHIVSTDNPRVRFRNRNYGLAKPDGSPTDLVLLIEYDTNGAAQAGTVLSAVPRPAYPEGETFVGGSVEAPVKTQPVTTPVATPAVTCPTEVTMKITRHLAQTGGPLRVVLPSGRERTVSLPPMLALRGVLKCVQMGEAKPEGGNCDLRITFQIEG